MRVNYWRVGISMLGEILIASSILVLHHAYAQIFSGRDARSRRALRQRERRLRNTFDSAAITARRQLHGVTGRSATAATVHRLIQIKRLA